jgi:hypothetical protein
MAAIGVSQPQRSLLGIFAHAESVVSTRAKYRAAEIVALETVGGPREDITGVVVCDR